MSSLAVGATVVLYDGSPFIPSPHVLWDCVDQLGLVIDTIIMYTLVTIATLMQCMYDLACSSNTEFLCCELQCIFRPGFHMCLKCLGHVPGMSQAHTETRP